MDLFGADAVGPCSGLSMVEIERKLYAVGGKTPEDSAALEVYDPSTNRWTPLAPLPDFDGGNAGRSDATAGVIDGKLYLAGGWRQWPPLPTSSLLVYNGYATSFYMYNPDSDTWTVKASPPNPYSASRSSTHINAAAVVLNGKLYLIGGAYYDGTRSGPMAQVEVYDPASNSWTTAASMPTARQALAAAATGGKIYVDGGEKVGHYGGEKRTTLTHKWRFPFRPARRCQGSCNDLKGLALTPPCSVGIQ